MRQPLDDTFRQLVARRCAAFERLPATVGGPALKRAAVALALLDTHGEAGFVLTLRAADLRSHSGQYALPGGRCDEGETAVTAALRELHEEVGLQRGPASVLGILDDYPTRSGYLITPVVVWAGEVPALTPNPQEVAVAHRIALAQITREDAVDFTRLPTSDRRVVRIRIGADYVHAPTAAVLYQFREVLAGRTTRVADLEQPEFAWR